LELRDIEYFKVIAECGNLGRAAESLRLSAPALSKCLRRLESAVDAKLVKRTAKGIELTPEGRALLPHVQRLQLSLADVTREIADVRRGRAGHLRVGCTTGVLEDLVGAACGLFIREAPQATLSVSVMGTDELAPTLREGKLDVAIGIIITASAPDLVHQYLFDDEFVVYASPQHRLAGRKRVSLAEVSNERWIRNAATGFSKDAFNRVFEDYGLKPPAIALDSTTNAVRLHAVAGSRLLYLAPKSLARLAAPRFSLVELPVKEIGYTRRNLVSYRGDTHLPPAGHRFIEKLKVAAKGLAG
jgi:DNA-binding transcriptional LysR family regulator